MFGVSGRRGEKADPGPTPFGRELVMMAAGSTGRQWMISPISVWLVSTSTVRFLPAALEAAGAADAGGAAEAGGAAVAAAAAAAAAALALDFALDPLLPPVARCEAACFSWLCRPG